MSERLAEFGFDITDTQATERGAHVEMSNGRVVVNVTADWLEGEIDITVNDGTSTRPVSDIVVLPKAVHLQRLGRGVSTDVVAAQLTKVAEALVGQASTALT